MRIKTLPNLSITSYKHKILGGVCLRVQVKQTQNIPCNTNNQRYSCPWDCRIQKRNSKKLIQTLTSNLRRPTMLFTSNLRRPTVLFSLLPGNIMSNTAALDNWRFFGITFSGIWIGNAAKVSLKHGWSYRFALIWSSGLGCY